MASKTFTAYIVHETWRGEGNGEFRLQGAAAHGRPGSLYTQVPVCETVVTVEIPDDFDPRPAQVEALRAQRDELHAQFALAVKQIDDRIRSLLAIEMSA